MTIENTLRVPVFCLGMLKPFIFETGNRFAETGFLPVTERPIVSGIIVTGRSALAISRSLVASRRPLLAYQTHGRRRSETKESGVSKR